MDIKDRIREIMLIKGTKSENGFSKAIGISQKTVNNQLNGLRSVSLDFVNAILDTYPDISAEWLLRGKGEMIVSDIPAATTSVLGNGNVVGNNIVNSEVTTSKEEPTRGQLLDKMDELQRMFNIIMCK